MELHRLPVLQVKPNLLIKYTLTEAFDNAGNNVPNSYLHNRHDIQSESNKTTGQLSPNSIRRLRTAINWLIAISPRKRVEYLDRDGWYWFRISFITLTIPCAQGTVSDSTIKRNILNPFLTDLRRKFGMRHYVWKAEAQKNGNIHFHITTNCWIHWQSIRDLWNKALEREGFVSAYAKRMRSWHSGGFKLRTDLLDHWPSEKQQEAYAYGIKTNWQSPNTIDVHAVRKIRNMAAYMVKYMSKNEADKRPIEGKLWDCSKSLKIKRKAELLMDSGIDEEWRWLKRHLPDRYKCDNYVEMLFTSPDEILTILPPRLAAAYREQLEAIKSTE